MKRYKRLYIVSLILIAVVLTSVCFSYAFFANKNEQHGKLNVVVGNLKYKLESNDLVNNSITVAPGANKEIKIKLTSLNNISSKYEIYYNSSNTSTIQVGYLNVSANGTIGANEVIEIDVLIKNRGTTNETVTFGLEKGLTNNQLVINNGNSLNKIRYCDYDDGYVWNFNYTGGEQSFTVPSNCSGTYKLETWGAQGGTIINTSASRTFNGGYGSYSSGSIQLTNSQKIYINVGGNGKSCTIYGTTTAGTTTCGNDGGYNGGGSTRQYTNNTFYGSGGGATHMATKTGVLSSLSSSINNVLIVSGGGGGASSYASIVYGAHGGSAGGITGSVAVAEFIDRSVSCSGGTQVSAGTGSDTSGEGFGKGGSITRYVGPGAGSGLYGGGTSEVLSCGGSSYIGNSLLSNKSMYCYNCQTSNEVNTKTVSTTCHSSNPTVNCAKEGNGYARITLVSIN